MPEVRLVQLSGAVLMVFALAMLLSSDSQFLSKGMACLQFSLGVLTISASMKREDDYLQLNYILGGLMLIFFVFMAWLGWYSHAVIIATETTRTLVHCSMLAQVFNVFLTYQLEQDIEVERKKRTR